ncbi:MAG: branched-chain amino acid ABC transporter permease [Desulfovibrio sp.]|jgi:branched-chain amino acid transport system permease protein|nr:branched-chain amino acid ABC transporter permease [Desulfovibrio sp.]
MDMTINVQLLFSGLAMGSIYALIALGIVIIYRAADVVNFAQGELVMLPAFIAVFLLDTMGLPAVAVYPLVIICMGLVGFIFEKVAYYPLRNRSFLPVIISTIGVSIFLKNGAQYVFGALPQVMPRPTDVEVLVLGGVIIDPQYIIIIVSTSLLLVAQHFFFERTMLGKMMQATAQDKDAARLMGIPIARMIAITFIFSTILASVAGLLVGPLFYVTKEMGGMAGLKGFCGAIIGGFGSVTGAILGSVFLGVIEVYLAFYVSSAYRDAFAFIIMILVLLFRPQGILGERIAQKA